MEGRDDGDGSRGARTPTPPPISSPTPPLLEAPPPTLVFRQSREVSVRSPSPRLLGAELEPLNSPRAARRCHTASPSPNVYIDDEQTRPATSDRPAAASDRTSKAALPKPSFFDITLYARSARVEAERQAEAERLANACANAIGAVGPIVRTPSNVKGKSPRRSATGRYEPRRSASRDPRAESPMPNTNRSPSFSFNDANQPRHSWSGDAAVLPSRERPRRSFGGVEAESNGPRQSFLDSLAPSSGSKQGGQRESFTDDIALGSRGRNLLDPKMDRERSQGARHTLQFNNIELAQTSAEDLDFTFATNPSPRRSVSDGSGTSLDASDDKQRARRSHRTTHLETEQSSAEVRLSSKRHARRSVSGRFKPEPVSTETESACEAEDAGTSEAPRRKRQVTLLASDKRRRSTDTEEKTASTEEVERSPARKAMHRRSSKENETQRNWEVQAEQWELEKANGLGMSEGSEDFRIRLSEIEDELSRLRPQLMDRRAKCAKLMRDVRFAYAIEIQQRDDLWTRQKEMDKRLVTIVTQMQRSWRGYLVRKKMQQLQQGEQAKIASWASSLPRQLRQNLKAMRAHTYNLRYRNEERMAAAILLQSWWRMLQVRRVAWILRVTQSMRVIYGEMNKAAVKLQSRFRSRLTRKYFIVSVRKRMEERKAAQLEEMQKGHESICRIQQVFRCKLGRRRAYEARARRQCAIDEGILAEETDSEAEKQNRELVLLDSWSSTYPNGHQPIRVPILQDIALEALSGTGCVPFFWATRALTPRHRIGGPATIETKPSSKTDGLKSCSRKTAAPANLVEASSPPLWDIYPKGFSNTFIRQDLVDPPKTLAPTRKFNAESSLSIKLPKVPVPAPCHVASISHGSHAKTAPRDQPIELKMANVSKQRGCRQGVFRQATAQKTIRSKPTVPLNVAQRAQERIGQRAAQEAGECLEVMAERMPEHPILAPPELSMSSLSWYKPRLKALL